MASYKVYVKMTYGGSTLYNSYYIISAKSKDEARKKARQRVKEERSPSPKAKVSITTSFDGFVK